MLCVCPHAFSPHRTFEIIVIPAKSDDLLYYRTISCVLGVLYIMFITSFFSSLSFLFLNTSQSQRQSSSSFKSNSQITPAKRILAWRRESIRQNESVAAFLLLLCVLKNVYDRRGALTQSFVNDTASKALQLIQKVSDDTTSPAITITTRPSSPQFIFYQDIFYFYIYFVYPIFYYIHIERLWIAEIVMMYTSSIIYTAVSSVRVKLLEEMGGLDEGRNS